jgi:upstream activation factor subunit UAF30
MWRRGYGRTRIGHGRRRGGYAPPDRVRGWRRDANRRRTMPTETLQKKTPQEQAPKAAGGGKANALQQPLRPSEALAAVVGPGPLPRGEVVSKVWDYIKAHNLQNPEDRREILADDTLRKVFGKDKVTMFEMNKHLAQHLA